MKILLAYYSFLLFKDLLYLPQPTSCILVDCSSNPFTLLSVVLFHCILFFFFFLWDQASIDLFLVKVEFILIKLNFIVNVFSEVPIKRLFDISKIT